MCKYILVPATGSDTDEPVFATALIAARLLPAHLEFLHVRADVQEPLTAMASTDMGGGGIGFDQIMRTLEQEVASQQNRAEVAFRRFCERERLPVTADPAIASVSAEWRMETGDEATWLAEHGRAADLLVLGRAREGQPVAMEMLESALMATGRPVLIAPEKPPRKLSGVVAIAWKDSAQAARAVEAARPFLELADEVKILSIIEEGTRSDEQSCERLRYALSWQNSRVTVQCLKQDGRPAVDALLAAATTANADLLVMGGYGHSRVREVIFGGFTRRILTHADLPILMAH